MGWTPKTEEGRRAYEAYREQLRSPAPHFCQAMTQPPPPPEVQPPEIGSRMTFHPCANLGNMGSGDIQGMLHRPVTGTVVQIHAAHRWYRVAYQMGDKPGCIGYECFKY